MNALLLLLTSLSFGSRADAKSVARPEPVAPPPAEPVAPPPPPVPDRRAPPAVQPASALDLPSPQAHALWDGLAAQHVQVEGLRKVQVVVSLHRGSVALCDRPVAAPCEALGDMLGVATGKTDASALEEALILLDAELYGSMGLRDTTITLSVPPEQLDQGLALLREALLTPAFPKDELKLLRRDVLLNYEAIWPTDANMVARQAREYAWFVSDPYYGARPDLEGWEQLAPAQLVVTHARLLAEAPATVLVVGSLPWESLEPKLRATLDGVGKPGVRADPYPAQGPSQSRLIAVDMPGQELSSIRLRVAAPDAQSADRASFQAAHFALGGNFMSRLNRVLREEKGWTYGAYGRYVVAPAYGVWDFGVDVATENTAEAITEILAEIAKVQEAGPTLEEVEAAAVDQLQTWNQRLSTSDSARGFYQQLLDQGDTVQKARARLDAIDAATPESARQAAAAPLSKDATRVWVVVGDRTKLEPELTGLGLTPAWVTPQQAILGQLP